MYTALVQFATASATLKKKACCFLWFYVLSSKTLLKAFDFASVQRKPSNEACVCTECVEKMHAFSSVLSLLLHKHNQVFPDRIFTL